jgi:transcriptional regulator with XRE-family HTH domain
MRHWRKRRGMAIATLADLLGRSPSWVQMAETGHRAPYSILELVKLTRALRVDLGVFLCDPVPGLRDGDQRQVLLALRDAFIDGDARAGLSHLAHRLADVEPGEDLMLVVLPGGQWKVVSRRDALKLGAMLGVSLAAPALGPDQTEELFASLNTREVSHAGIGALRAVVTAYRRLDDEIGSASLRPLVQHNLQVVNGLRARSEDVRVALGTVAAELHQLSGWLSFDAGDYDASSAHYRAALRAAERAGNAAMAAHVLGWMSYLTSATRHPQEGIRIADSALRRARETPSRRLRASLARMKAHAHARAGEVQACERLLGQAGTELAAADPADNPEFIYWFDEAVLLAHAGIADVLLERPAQARAALERSLMLLDPSWVRDRAFHLAWLAASHVQADEIPEACRVGIEAAALLDQASSERTAKLLKELHRVRLRPHWHMPVVRELGDRLYAL